MTQANGKRQRGFSMLIAITCIALVGTALVLIARLVSDDARRTGRELVETQQRQLLLASHRLAQATFDANRFDAGELSTPAELEASLRIESVNRPAPDEVVATIRATLGSSSLRERATFRSDGNRWRFSHATIER